MLAESQLQASEQVGFNIPARSVAEAIQLGGQFKSEIHVLVTDVIMPGMSGKDLAERLQGLRPLMRVLFVSGYTDDALGHHGVLKPGTHFLQKPFTRDALACKVRDILDSSNASD